MNNDFWLDSLSDGKLFRQWLALFVYFPFGVAYFVFLIGGLALALSLSVVFVGIPLLLLMLSSARTLATLDRKVMAAILDVDPPPDFEDVNMRGANLGQRLGMLLGSGATWRSLLYLLLKLPVGIATFMLSFFILFPLAFEVLILAPLTIDLHLITVRLIRWSAIGLYKLHNFFLPSGKLKRRSRRLPLEQAEDELEDEPRYYMDAEGEIAVAKRGR